MLRDTWTRLASAVAFVVVIALASSAMAAAKKSFPLMGQEDSPKAKGAIIQDSRLTVTANGLKPNAVYTVWFVNMQPTMTQEGAGTPPFTFKTDKKGRAKYVATLKESPIGKWQSIMIVRHPSGDPKDMSHMEDALMAKLM